MSDDPSREPTDDPTPAVSAAAQGPRVGLREVLAGLPAYVAGRPAAARTDLTAYKISSNENPYPPLPSVLDVVHDAAGEMNRYPDMGVSALTARIAREHGVDPACVATGTGSVGVLGQIVQALCDAGDEVVYAWRSFEAYPIVVALTGARSVQVPVDAGGRHDLAAMRAAITPRTKVVLVCTPNNPTGPAVTDTALRAFVAAVPPEVLVVVDEAYVEFVTGEDPVDALALLPDHPNVVVLRTFSKAYGLAGLRVGYAVAAPPVAEALRKTAVPFGVSTIAQRAAVASLDAYDELDVRVKELVAERERVLAGLRDQGWDIPDTEANFVWFPLDDDAVPFARLCDAHGLTVRPFAGDGVRATIGETEACDRLLDLAARWRAGERAPST